MKCLDDEKVELLMEFIAAQCTSFSLDVQVRLT
jgi:hypothetical protein